MNKFLRLSIIIGLTVYFFYDSMIILQQNQQGIILEFGHPKKAINGPGVYWKYPLIQKVVINNKQPYYHNFKIEKIITKDQKDIKINLFSGFKITNILHFYKSLNNIDTAKARLSKLINESAQKILELEEFREVLGKNRLVIVQKIQDDINKKAKILGIKVVNLIISKLHFSASLKKSVIDAMKNEYIDQANKIKIKGTNLANTIKSEADFNANKIITDAKEKATLIRSKADSERINILNKVARKNPKLYNWILILEQFENFNRVVKNNI